MQVWKACTIPRESHEDTNDQKRTLLVLSQGRIRRGIVISMRQHTKTQRHPETRGEFIRGIWVPLPDNIRKYGDTKFRKIYQKIKFCPESGAALKRRESRASSRSRLWIWFFNCQIPDCCKDCDNMSIDNKDFSKILKPGDRVFVSEYGCRKKRTLYAATVKTVRARSTSR